MFISRKKFNLEMKSKDITIANLSKIIEDITLAEIELIQQNKRLEDKIRFLNRQLENKDEQIERLGNYLSKVSDKSDKEITLLEQKLVCKDDDIGALKIQVNKYKNKINKFDIDAINSFKSSISRVKSTRIKKKKQKKYNEKLIEIFNKLGEVND